MRFAPAIPLLLMSAPCVAQIMSGNLPGYVGPNSQTNNPVSMVYEHKQTQTLVDGTHISTVTHEYFYRDSLGRTRMENENSGFGFQGNDVHFVTVIDPVAGTFTNWQSGPAGIPRLFNRSDMHPSSAQQVVPSGAGAHVTQAVQPAPVSNRPHPEMKDEPLGTEDVQGISCEASRTTVVYPVDFFGNDRPITTVSERCQSREFGRTLRDTTDDPRSGMRSTTLQSVSRGEPEASLFQPPPDYIDSKSATR